MDLATKDIAGRNPLKLDSGQEDDEEEQLIARLAVAALSAGVAWAQMGGMSGMGGGGGYGGPAVGTRGMKQAGSRGSEPVSIRPFIGINGVSDSGMIVASLDSKGNLTNPGTLFGIEAQGGAYGSKEWKKDRLGLDYQGSIRHYTQKTFFDGTDQFLNLSWTHQIDRRSGISIGTVAGITSRPVGGSFGLATFDPSIFGTTMNDLIDNRAYFAQGNGTYTRVIGRRIRLSLGGSGFAVRRRSAALVGMNGHQATAGFERTIGRNGTLGLVYTYMHVDYPRVFGEGDVHTVMATFSRQFGRRWLFNGGAGVFGTDYVGVRTVQLDPAIAELLGQRTGREVFNRINRSSAIQVGLSRQFRRSAFNVNYMRGANPGNGVILLNRMETFGASYSFNTGNQWAYDVHASLGTMAGFGSFNDRQKMYGVGASANRRLWADMHLSLGFDVRAFDVNAGNFQRTGSRAIVGLTYSPGSIPLAFR